MNSWRSRQCRRRYCVHGTNDVENQARFKATQVNRSFSRQILAGQRKKKQTSPLFFCFSQFFFILFPPHQWRLIKCRVYHYFIILQLVISTFMIYFLLLHTSLFKNQCSSEIRAVLCSRVSFSPLFVSSIDLPSNRVEIGR